MKLFSGSASKSLAEKISKSANIPLGKIELFKFPDSEKRIRVLDEVLDEETWIVQSRGSHPDSSIMELFFIVDALKRSGAASVGVIVPYLSYQRQDHIFRSGEAVSLEVIAKTLERAGADKLITFDLHTIKIPEVFNIPVIHLSALPLFANEIKKMFTDLSSVSIASPDMGGIRRIKILSEMLSVPYAVIEKNRDLSTGEIVSSKLEGEVKENAILIDDMISTGGTIDKAAALLLKNGAKTVMAFATHPVFSKETPLFFENSNISEVFVTDSIKISKDRNFPKLTVLTLADLIAEELRK